MNVKYEYELKSPENNIHVTVHKMIPTGSERGKGEMLDCYW
jgi:hypothetical protein